MSDVDDFLPLTPRVFLLLWALARGGRMHGYALLSEVETLGAGQVSIGPASLYESIQTLAKRGLIEPADAPEGADRRRRYFRLSDTGEEALRTEARRLSDLVEDLRDEGVLDRMKAR